MTVTDIDSEYGFTEGPCDRLAKLGIVRAADLMAKTLPEPSFIVEPYIAEGLALLAGAPKLGKSWLMLSLALSVAAGRPALGGLQTSCGAVLMLALEDNERRLQSRIKTLLQGSEVPADLDLVSASVGWRRLNDGGIDDLTLWLGAHPGAKLIVIDTLQKVKALRGQGADVYATDYESLEGLKRLADDHNVAIVCVHHLRKSKADDPLEEISGSTGLTGATDAALVLKRDRAKADGVLFATGRDIEEREDALSFDNTTGLWTVKGPAEEYRRSKERAEIVRLLEKQGPMAPKDVAEILGKNQSTTRSLLAKMAADGIVTRLNDGTYQIRGIDLNY